MQNQTSYLNYLDAYSVILLTIFGWMLSLKHVVSLTRCYHLSLLPMYNLLPCIISTTCFVSNLTPSQDKLSP